MTKKKNNCIPIFFPNFRPFFTLPFSVYPPPDDRHAPSTKRGDQPTARRPYMANILYYTLNFTSTGSPSPRSGGALPPPSPYTPTSTPHVGPWLAPHTSHILFFFKKKCQKFFGALSLGPQGSRPHFRIPLLTLHTLKFFPPLHLYLRLQRSGGPFPPPSPLHHPEEIP